MRNLGRELLMWNRLDLFRIDLFSITGVAKILTRDVYPVGDV